MRLALVTLASQGRELWLPWRAKWKRVLQQTPPCLAAARCNLWTKIRAHSTVAAAEGCRRSICEDLQKHLRCTGNVGGKAAVGIRLRTRRTPMHWHEFLLTGSADSATRCGRRRCARPNWCCY